MTCSLFAYTFRGHPLLWCATLLENSIHSLTQLIVEIDQAFHHFDRKALNKEILELRKPPNESVFLKLKLIRNSSMEYLTIFFTSLKIHSSWNHLNPSQRTSVLELPNLRQTRSLPQVTVRPFLIKQL